jgi:aminoglycoside phosphotransferase (APT) family kinase protein
MVIDDARLLQGLLQNLDELAGLATQPQAQAIVKSSQAIGRELWRRADGSGAYRRYADGRGLIVAAAQLLAAEHPAKRQALTELLQDLPERLPPQRDASSRDALFEDIRLGIRLCFDGSRYPTVEDPRFKAVLDAMSEWERGGYAQQAPPPAVVPAEDQLVEVNAALLQDYLRSHHSGYESATVSGFVPIAGGFSKQTILFDVDVSGRRQALVYRGATKIQIIEPVLVDIAHEFEVVSYAFAAGAPVAEPLWLQADGHATGTRFFVSRRVPGVNLGTAVRAHAPIPAGTTRALAEALARIHTLPLDAADERLQRSHIRPPAPGVSLDEVIRRRVAAWRAYFRSLDAPTYPSLELAFDWLLDNVAEEEADAPVLVHGDYGLHNILVHEERVSAVLDWEACHVGDRALDLSHILAGTRDAMDHELFMDAYIAAGGSEVSPFRLKYYQVLMSMQFMLSTIDAQHIFQRRPAAGTNYCTLGLGFIEHTANSVVDGIRDAGAAKRRS